MDNLAHTLVGAALGRALGEERVPAPALLGAIAANAPDWMELVIGGRWRPENYLLSHRGITHSLIGALVQAVFFTLVTGAVLAWRARRGGPPPRWRWIAALFAVTVASHLYMDWQGSYGLRPFLPWNATWYYGDWVAIVDPFYWFVPLVALAWGGRRHWWPGMWWTLLLLPPLVLVTFSGAAAFWVKAASLAIAIVGVIGWHRHWFGVAARRTAAIAALGVLSAYTLAQIGVGTVVQHRARAAALARFGPGATSGAMTIPGRPFHWDVLLASRDTVAGDGWSVPRHLDDPIVRRALASSDGYAMSHFSRFLVAVVDTTPTGTEVRFRDARYARTARTGFATRRVRLP
jgi:inner membrane protein